MTIFNQLKQQYEESNDGDQWGNCMAWRFAVSDWLTDYGNGVPDNRQFRPAMGGSDTDSYEYQAIDEQVCGNLADVPEIELFEEWLYDESKRLEELGLDY